MAMGFTETDFFFRFLFFFGGGDLCFGEIVGNDEDGDEVVLSNFARAIVASMSTIAAIT